VGGRRRAIEAETYACKLFSHSRVKKRKNLIFEQITVVYQAEWDPIIDQKIKDSAQLRVKSGLSARKRYIHHAYGRHFPEHKIKKIGAHMRPGSHFVPEAVDAIEIAVVCDIYSDVI
jgi:hypothetical protein